MPVGQDNELDVGVGSQRQAVAGIEQRLRNRPPVGVPVECNCTVPLASRTMASGAAAVILS